MSSPQGEVTLTRSFTPWGELLRLTGQGNFTWGYLGGVLDAATGLIYVGNGQYYDPATGRFLSRGVNPGATNPYVPWQGNPAGMIVGPLALLALLRGKRKVGKIDQFLVLMIVVLAVSMTISGCSPQTTTPTSQPPDGQEDSNAPSTTSTSTADVTDRPIMYQWYSPKMRQEYSPTLYQAHSPIMYQGCSAKMYHLAGTCQR